MYVYSYLLDSDCARVFHDNISNQFGARWVRHRPRIRVVVVQVVKTLEPHHRVAIKWDT